MAEVQNYRSDDLKLVTSWNIWEIPGFEKSLKKIEIKLRRKRKNVKQNQI
jgi:hypothetical protein